MTFIQNFLLMVRIWHTGTCAYYIHGASKVGAISLTIKCCTMTWACQIPAQIPEMNKLELSPSIAALIRALPENVSLAKQRNTHSISTVSMEGTCEYTSVYTSVLQGICEYNVYSMHYLYFLN